MELKQHVVNGIDWSVVGLVGAMVVLSVVGAAFALRYSGLGLKRRPVAKEFNYLWRARSFTMILAATYALSNLLRLQIFWGPASVFRDGGFYPSTVCRVYTAATYGVFEPAFLLLALFALLYSVQGRESSPNPNFNIVLFSAGFSLPTCAAQLVAALFTRIFDLNYAGSHLLRMLFSTQDTSLQEHCPPNTRPGSCSFCTFPLLSTFISTAFAAVYLTALWVVTQRIATVVINKALVRRVRLIQLLITTFVLISLACRGVTVLFEPFELGFEALIDARSGASTPASRPSAKAAPSSSSCHSLAASYSPPPRPRPAESRR